MATAVSEVEVINSAEAKALGRLEDERETGGAVHRGGTAFKTRIRLTLDVKHAETGFYIKCGNSFRFAGPGTPRHHHEFEQVRYYLHGKAGYGRRLYGPGACQYISEGAWYGPQTYPDESRGIIFQFPGPSNIDRGPPGTVRVMAKEMMAEGVVFKDGLAYFPDGKVQDGAEATMERYLGHKMVYPPARFEDPVWMFEEHFRWRPTGREGVKVKSMGLFNDCGPSLSLLRIEPGGVSPARTENCIDIRQNIEGEIEYEGKPLELYSRLYFPPGVPHGETTSRNGATLLVFRLALPGGDPPEFEVV